MRILYIDHYAGSPELGMEYRPWHLAKYWQKAGHEVTILASTFSHLRKEKEDIDHIQILDQEGVSFIWVPTPPYEGNGVKRVRNIFSFILKCLKNLKTIIQWTTPDLVITSSTYPLDIIIGEKISKRSGARLVHEIHDLWPLTLTEIGGFSQAHPFIILLQIAENRAYRKADKVVSILPCAKEHLMAHGMKPDKFIHIPNGIEIAPWEKGAGSIPGEHERILGKSRKEDRIIVGYVGGHGLSNDLDTLLDAAKHIKDDRIRIFMIGDGPQKQRLAKRIEDEKIHNVTMLSAVNKNAVPPILKMMDILVVTLKPSPLYRFGVGLNKWFDYMMAGKPIVQAINAGNDPIEECGCGKTLSPGKPKDMARTLEEVAGMEQNERERMGQKGREYVIANHEYSILAEKFLSRVMDENSDT